MKFKELIKQLGTARKPLLAVLIDPDKFNPELVKLSDECGVDCFLVGGSKLEKGSIDKTITDIKRISKLPVVLFPGDETQLSKRADGLLLLSLLSGRNPDYLIEKHIAAAPVIKKMKLDYLSTAYLLIDGGKASTTQKVTKTEPLNPSNVTYIVNTVIAAEQLGFKAVYLEAGSGAKTNVSPRLVKKIKGQISIPIIIGGGINSPEKMKRAIDSGANMIVVGNALEKNVYLVTKLSAILNK
jgi:phosphoglycerol geranylgeranyltransferase